MMKQAKLHGLASLLLIVLPLAAGAQVPVDDDGNVIGGYEAGMDASASGATGNEDIPLLTPAELEELVGPIALYPDDLLAIVLPATTYPLQIIEAARFLEELEQDSSLKPDPDWDDSVVALLNYPEVVALLNDEIDWTWQLGEAVVAQQTDVVGAIESFRDRAYAAGNLKSDEYQTVSRDSGVIEITPVAEDVIYVPYYEPERVVVYQPRPVYYYYPRAYPVYYYPYPSSYVFDRGFFWGVTTAFTIGWVTDSLHVYHHSYYGHPYYGRSYWDYWWYRRPSVTVYNTTYLRNRSVTVNHYYTGDRWQPRHDRRRPVRPTEPRVMNRHYYDGGARADRGRVTRSVNSREPIRFRERSDRVRSSSRDQVADQVRDSRERIARHNRDRRDVASSVRRESRYSDRATTQNRSRQDVRPATSRSVRRDTGPVAQRETRRESRPTPERQTVRRESRPTPERQTVRRESRPTPERQTVRRESRPTPERQTVRRESRPTPERQTVRRESRPTPQRQTVRRESRPTPERQAVRREAQPRPQRQSRPESRPTRQKAESRRSVSAERKERSKDRKSAH
jgi:hypothetical protein